MTGQRWTLQGWTFGEGLTLTHEDVEVMPVAEYERLREAAQSVLDSAKPWLGRFEVGLDHALLSLRAAVDNTEEDR